MKKYKTHLSSSRIHFFKFLAFIFVSFAFTVSSWATIISNSGVEVEYSYTVDFRSLVHKSAHSEISAQKLADFHASHIFGIFQSADYAEKFDFPKELTEGFAASKYSLARNIKTYTKNNDDYIWLQYSVSTRGLLLNAVANAIFGENMSADYFWPLLTDLTHIYTDDLSQFQSKNLIRCTDPHYNLPEDFYYFYNPFRCHELSTPPYGQNILFHLKKINSAQSSHELVPLKKLRADNGNGKLVVLYFTYGFDGEPETANDIRSDAGWKLFSKLDRSLTKTHAFQQVASVEELREQLGSDFSKIHFLTPTTLNHETQRRFFRTYVRTDRDITWVVRSALFNTENEVRAQPLLAFPKFWKEAWENGDFIYYGGHSGDGKSLSLNNMLANFKKEDIQNIQFQKNKSQ